MNSKKSFLLITSIFSVCLIGCTRKQVRPSFIDDAINEEKQQQEAQQSGDQGGNQQSGGQQSGGDQGGGNQQGGTSSIVDQIKENNSLDNPYTIKELWDKFGELVDHEIYYVEDLYIIGRIKNIAGAFMLWTWKMKIIRFHIKAQ